MSVLNRLLKARVVLLNGQSIHQPSSGSRNSRNQVQRIQIATQSMDEGSDLSPLTSSDEDIGSEQHSGQHPDVINVQTEKTQDSSCIPIYGSALAPVEGWQSENDADSEHGEQQPIQHAVAPVSLAQTKRKPLNRTIKPSLNLGTRMPNCTQCGMS